MSERAVRRWLKEGTAPTWERHSRRRSPFDPYAKYVLQLAVWREHGIWQGDSTPAVEHSHMLVAISLEGEILRSRSFWEREQELCHLRGTIQLGPMPLLRQEREV